MIKIKKFFFRNKKSKKAIAKAKSDKRQRKLTRKQNRQKLKIQAKKKSLVKSRVLLKQSLIQIRHNKRIFIGISFVYILLMLVFVRGFNGTFPLKSIQESVDLSYGAELNPWAKASASYGLLLGSGTSTNSEVEYVYQIIIILILSLALIFVIRKTYKESKKIKLKNAFYRSTGQLIPFITLLFIGLIQLIPFGLASTLFGYVMDGGIASSGPEQIFWYIVLISGFFISFRMLINTIVALYIVTLNSMTPIRAMREASLIVRFMRVKIGLRILFLLTLSFVASGLVLIPLIVLFPPGAEVMYLVFSSLFLNLLHTYTYRLYRSLL